MNTPAGQSKPTPVETVLVSFDSDPLLLGRSGGGIRGQYWKQTRNA
jgi:hypothetical protein